MNQKGFIQYLVITLILIGIGAAVYLTQFTQIFKPKANENPPGISGEHIIGKTMINGKPFLYNKASGRIFIPRGNNYSNTEAIPNPFYQTTSTSGWEWFSDKIKPGTGKSFYESNRDQIIADLTKMEQDGYNSIRISVSLNAISNYPNPGLNQQVLANMAEFIQIAKNQHIFVYISAAELPHSGDWIPSDLSVDNPLVNTTPGANNYNWNYMSKPYLQMRIRYWKELIQGLKAHGAPLDAIWAYDIGGTEIGFAPQSKPFKDYTGTITTNGGDFQVFPGMSEDAKREIMDKNAIAYINGLHDAVKEVDPAALTSIQIFPPALHSSPGQEHDAVFVPYVPAKWLVASPDITEGDLQGVKADLIGLSLYPNTFGVNYNCQISSLLIPGVGGRCDQPGFPSYPLRAGVNTKPIFVQEMGYVRNMTVQESVTSAAVAGEKLKNWMQLECQDGIRGWHQFTWSAKFNPAIHFVSDYFNALEENEGINNAIKPANFYNVCGDNLDSGPGIGAGTTDSVPVYAFVEHANPKNVFYTASENEKDYTLKTGQWWYGSNTWYSSTKPGPGLKPVYGLSLKAYGGTHMYTISEQEKQQLLNTGLWQENGPVWYAYDQPGPGLLPVYRFKSTHVKTQIPGLEELPDPYENIGDLLHYFIAYNGVYDQSGKDNFLNLGWIYEGPVWYATQFPQLGPINSPPPTTPPSPPPNPSPSASSSPSTIPSSPASPLPSGAAKPGDIDNDGDVDLQDVNEFVRLFPLRDLRIDLNNNGRVDIFDFNILVTNYKK